MSGLPRTRTLWITPLSPVHMGTGEDYVPTNYVIEDEALFEFDVEALTNLPEADRRALDRILNGKPETRMIRQVQAFFHERRERLIPHAVNLVRTCRGVAALYRARVGKAANVEASGKEAINQLAIERAAYNPGDRRLLLPGSGLKGAIRTALLDQINQGRPLPPDLKGDRRANQKLQERLFGYSMRELHKDPMRLVQVSDARWCGPESLNSAEILFAVNRKKQPVTRNGKEVRSQAKQGNLPLLLECAAPLRLRAFRSSLAVSDVHAADDHPALPKLRFDFEAIAAACNAFYRPIFDRELERLQARSFLDASWHQTVQTLLDDPGLQKRLEENCAFLLRVGRHSGAESVTLNGVRNIKIMQGKGQPPAREPEARTWWLAAREKDDRHGLMPFGWLLVEMGQAPDWPTAESLTEAIHREQAAWLEKVLDRRRRLAGQLEAIRQKEQERARAEAERRRREEEQARRLAAMSEEERRIEAVRALLERDRQANCKEPGGELNEQRLKLLEAALQWEDAELRRQAADLLEETARFLPWAKKRKKAIREKLSALRQA
ncbi:CRISPR-associated protein Csm5 [Methylomarinovum tepidoasis]|uniref:CRISPR system Cms protein Csm5 n=1 Tax=Methylomarinovum tepidoasis TaxID=2840183 RepID=A0AAU9CDR5_9GAMM|nr:RAMP superfamily CRISPR-associated protein [Methylomarinovum sp. IN45]BCX88936.1 CRISPR-associated protein Csm5 [Methylomarinovum sp. IN45]